MLRLCAVLILFLTTGFAASAQPEPWAARRTNFGLTAFGSTAIAPSTPSAEYNILGLGLFCGRQGINSGQINLYLYGIGADRLGTGKPLAVSFDIDGAATAMTLKPRDDVVLTTVSAEWVRRLMQARSASIRVRDYNYSPKPDRIVMTGAPRAIQSALKGCFQP